MNYLRRLGASIVNTNIFLFKLLLFLPQSSVEGAKQLTEQNVFHCASLDLEVCEVRKDGDCLLKNRTNYEVHWKHEENYLKKPVTNVTSLLSVSSGEHCYLTLCDEEERMGYCIQFPAGVSSKLETFRNLLQSDLLGIDCKCGKEKQVGNKPYSQEDFDKNYVGVVYSPYDKLWEPIGPNGTRQRVSWREYSQDEISDSLKKISQKFSYISTYGMGTASNTSEWYEGDKVAFVPYLSAKINANLGYLGLRVSVGIFRKDDVLLSWKPKEMYNAIEAAKVANRIFNGTVWGIIVTSDYVKDEGKAFDAIQMINEVKSINTRDKLNLKVGIRLTTCNEFIANKRPEDDAVPAYTQDNPYFNKSSISGPVNIKSLTGFQNSLYSIAKLCDYILCSKLPPPELGYLPFHSVVRIMQDRFLDLKQTLRQVNPKLRLFIETGVPSEGLGNGYRNSLADLRDYWKNMSDFSKKHHIMFHMFEAVDQPWKNVEDGSNDRVDINGPNGTDAHYGWWRRINNSEPLAYVEKIGEIKASSLTAESSGKPPEDATIKIVILSFVGFAVATMSIMGYLWRKLHKAKTEVISQAYVDQFHSGGDDSSSADENYAVALRIPYDKKLELVKGAFHIDKWAVMGSGQSGIVCRGRIQCRPEPVAFKCTTPRSTVVDIKAIMSEIKILSYIGHHENLVCILGAYTKKIQRGIVYVGLEFCKLGSLESFLRKTEYRELPTTATKEDYENMKAMAATRYVTISPNGKSAANPGYIADLPSLTTPVPCETEYVTTVDFNATHAAVPSEDTVDFFKMVQWSAQIASAMEYVAGKNVVHADLAARNVLLYSMDQVKVSDFGLSRKMYQEMGVTHDKDTPLPWRWMGPESIRHLAFSSQSDVWAFGVTIWEIFSLGEVPYHGISYDMGFAEKLIQGMRLPTAKYSSPEITEMLKKCWDITPSNRPSFKELKHFFLYLVDER